MLVTRIEYTSYMPSETKKDKRLWKQGRQNNIARQPNEEKMRIQMPQCLRGRFWQNKLANFSMKSQINFQKFHSGVHRHLATHRHRRQVKWWKKKPAPLYRRYITLMSAYSHSMSNSHWRDLGINSSEDLDWNHFPHLFPHLNWARLCHSVSSFGKKNPSDILWTPSTAGLWDVERIWLLG